MPSYLVKFLGPEREFWGTLRIKCGKVHKPETSLGL
jgi:hypothetical protein